MKHNMKITKAIFALLFTSSLTCFGDTLLNCNVIVPQENGTIRFKKMNSEETNSYQSFHRLEFRLKEIASGTRVFESPTDDQVKSEITELAYSVQESFDQLPYSLMPQSLKRKQMYAYMSEVMEEYKSAFVLLSVSLENPSEGHEKDPLVRYVVADMNDRVALAGLKSRKQKYFQTLATLAPVKVEVPFRKLDGAYGSTEISIVCKALTQ